MLLVSVRRSTKYIQYLMVFGSRRNTALHCSIAKSATGKMSHKNTMDNSVVGKVHSVTVENFMTFGNAVFHPGPHLNVLIGPNGTGKSSMVAAIVLGMGGSTKVLSAKLKLQEFIKNGKEAARIIVCLYKNTKKEKVNFERSFIANGRSTFKINGHKVTDQVYMAEIKLLNIQVDNMCQFLPQDRVQDFAKQNPQELLNSTQQSVCSTEVIEMFKKLKSMRNDQLHGKEQVQSYHTLLKENEERLDILTVHVENIRKKNELVEEREVCVKKQNWLIYEELFQKCKVLMDDLKKANGQYQILNRKQKEIELRAVAVLSTRKKYEDECRHKADELKTLSHNAGAVKERIEKTENDVTKAEGDFKELQRRVNDMTTEMNNMLTVLQAFEVDFKDEIEQNRVGDYENRIREITPQMATIKDKISDLINKRSSLQTELDEIKIAHNRTVSNLKKMENSQDSKLEILKKMNFEDAYKAVLWLRKNLHHFRSKVYEPILLEINLKKLEYAKYVENCVAVRDLTAFVCEDADDMSLLIRELQQEGLNCNAVHSGAANSVKFVPKTPVDELRQFGVECYLLDCLDAPPSILNYLCRAYNVHNVVIGNQALDTHCERLPAGIQVIFTPTKRIQVTISKYTKQKSSLSATILPKKLLGEKTDQREIEAVKATEAKLVRQMDGLHNTRNKMEEAIGILEVKNARLSNHKNELMRSASKLTECQNKITRQKQKIENAKRNQIDLDKEKTKFDKITDRLIGQMIESQKEYAEILSNYLRIKCGNEVARVRLMVFNKSCSDIDNELAEIRNKTTEAKVMVDRIQTLLNNNKHNCKAKQAETLAMTNNCKPSDPMFPYRKQFQDLPNNFDDLAEKISEIESQIELMTADNEGSLHEHNQRQENIRLLKEQIESSTNSFAKLEKAIHDEHNKWYPKIIATLETINSNFEMFMCSMGCAGEVALIQKDLRDYDSYGIEIKVKYRANEKLQPLDRFVQSGGERAVAIAVYSLSLQQLTQVPFRCVDEINQGMDPDNERKIFDMLVAHVAQERQSQFFYVTPKLLPNMSHNKFVSCSVVHNGVTTDYNDYFPIV